jgi:hypothetical protein
VALVVLFLQGVVFSSDDVDVVAFDGTCFGIPHIFDSVVLTCLSPGSHIAALCSGVNDDDEVLYLLVIVEYLKDTLVA